MRKVKPGVYQDTHGRQWVKFSEVVEILAFTEKSADEIWTDICERRGFAERFYWALNPEVSLMKSTPSMDPADLDCAWIPEHVATHEIEAMKVKFGLAHTHV